MEVSQGSVAEVPQDIVGLIHCTDSSSELQSGPFPFLVIFQLPREFWLSVVAVHAVLAPAAMCLAVGLIQVLAVLLLQSWESLWLSWDARICLLHVVLKVVSRLEFGTCAPK